MERRDLAVAVFLVIAFATCHSGIADDHTITFLNPGSRHDVGVWHMTSRFMQAAAEDLGVKLEVLYADRNHIKMILQAEAVSKRVTPPDYVIMVNEKKAGREMLMRFRDSPTKIFFIHNGLTHDQRAEVGNERETFKNWIGTIISDETRAGYALAEGLLKQFAGQPKILAITGTASTPVSFIRLQGLKNYLARHERGTILQVVHGKWSIESGQSMTTMLLKRYSDANVIWAANDSMALGAFQAVKAMKADRRIVVGGMGGFPQALKSIKAGEMRLTVGGHPMIGAWALVLITDYHAGTDFVKDIGTNASINHLFSIDDTVKADLYADLVLNNPRQIDFRRFSKRVNPERKRYDFSFAKVIEAARKREAQALGPSSDGDEPDD